MQIKFYDSAALVSRFMSSGTWRRVVWWAGSNISEESPSFHLQKGDVDGGSKFLRYLVLIYQTSRRNNREICNLNTHCRENVSLSLFTANFSCSMAKIGEEIEIIILYTLFLLHLNRCEIVINQAKQKSNLKYLSFMSKLLYLT
jgi:hypothetical protein